MYNNRDAIGGFAAGYYWSSSGNNANYAWPQDFNGGYQGVGSKDFTAYVRPVRAF